MNFEKIAKILADYKEIDACSITPETTFEELELDSLDTVELVMKIEEEMGITIEMNENIKTVADLIQLAEGSVSND